MVKITDAQQSNKSQLWQSGPQQKSNWTKLVISGYCCRCRNVLISRRCRLIVNNAAQTWAAPERGQGATASCAFALPPSSCPCRKNFDGGTSSCQDV